MEENQNLPPCNDIPKVTVDLKQTTSGRWYVGSFKININNADEFDELFDKVYGQVDKKLILLNNGVGTGVNHSAPMILNSEEERLFMKLRKARMDVSMKEGFPPYVIFHDSVLREIAKQKPANPEALRSIIGDKKFEKYGEIVLNNLK